MSPQCNILPFKLFTHYYRWVVFLLTLLILILADDTEGGATTPSSNGIGQEKDNVTLESKL